jgi:outer membrane murein-binding lipoprotein Lpp
MKPLRLHAAAIVLMLLVGISLGCQHKKPVLVVPQQQPPTAAPQPSPTPEPAAQAADQPLVPAPEPTSAEQPKTAETPKPKHGRHAAAKKPSPAVGGEKPGGEVAKNVPPKTKIIPADKTEPPATSIGQISPGTTPADTTDSQTSTDQLLQGAEANLNSITRQLSKDEEAMRTQIKAFIKQSHNATTENDPVRAHNLAVKARLLSDDLVKQR